jgi:phage gp46-like protein
VANTANLDIQLTNYNQRTGRYNLAVGPGSDVQFDDTQAYAVQTAVGCIRGAWWADDTVGSRLSQLQSLTTRTAATAAAVVQEALDPLVSAGKILEPVVQPPQAIRGFANVLSIDADYSTPGGTKQKAAFRLT